LCPANFMERHPQHLPLDSIRNFARGVSVLKPHELDHFQECDECCATWWKLKQEAKREKGEEAKEKSA